MIIQVKPVILMKIITMVPVVVQDGMAVAAAEEVVVVQVVGMAEMAAGRISVMHKMAVMLQGTVLLQFLVQIIAMVALLFKLMQKAGSETLFRVAQENPVL